MGIYCLQANSKKKPHCTTSENGHRTVSYHMTDFAHYSAKNHDKKSYAVGDLSAVAAARAVEWRWIWDRLVVVRLRVLAVERRWWSSGGRISGGGGLVVVVVVV
jgi:hypothetical protein